MIIFSLKTVTFHWKKILQLIIYDLLCLLSYRESIQSHSLTYKGERKEEKTQINFKSSKG